MGHTIKPLAKAKLDEKAIFDKRMVVELCEQVHVHYRNLRILLGINDFASFAKGMADAYSRWQKRGGAPPAEGVHLELARKEVATQDVVSQEIQINHNLNLYKRHEGQVFAEGADFDDDTYIHLKIRDLRVELSLSEFQKLAKCVKDADEKLQDCYSDPVPSEA